MILLCDGAVHMPHDRQTSKLLMPICLTVAVHIICMMFDKTCDDDF